MCKKRKNKKLRILLALFVIAFAISIYTIPSAFSRFLSTKTLLASLNITKPIFTITLDEQSSMTHGTTAIYEKHAIGYYLNSSATTQMTTSSNPITKPTKNGYLFGGYYTATNGGGTKYIDENGKLTSQASTTNFSSNGTLYAYWIRVKAENLSYDNTNTSISCSDSQCVIDTLSNLLK